MLIPCVECGTKSYTEESPLWYHCNKCLHPAKYKHCDGCGNDFPKTHLVYLYFLNGHYCDRCYGKQKLPDEVMFYCDGCGEDFPRTHLEYVPVWDGYFCERCQE